MIEDLEGRRSELREEIETIKKTNDQMRHMIDRKLRPHFFSFSYLIRQYTKREELSASLAKARLYFRTEMAAVEDKEERGLLLRAVERMATLRRVEALIYLHRLLKVWIAPHVISTSVMLVLMIAHIAQVVFFNLR